MSYFTNVLSEVCKQEGLDFPLHIQVDGNYVRASSPKLEGFQLLEYKKPGQPDYIFEARNNNQMIWYSHINHKDYKVFNMYKPARELVTKLKQLTEEPGSEVQANRFSKEIWAQSQMSNGEPSRELVNHKWNEIVSILRNKGDMRATHTLNDLINHMFTAYTFNNSTYEGMCQMLDQIKQVVESGKVVNAIRDWRTLDFSPKPLSEYDQICADINNMRRYPTESDINEFTSRINQIPEGLRLPLMSRLKKKINEITPPPRPNRFAKEKWVKAEEDACEYLKDRFGQNIPEKIVKKILEEHGYDLYEFQKDINYDGSGFYDVDKLMNWMGY